MKVDFLLKNRKIEIDVESQTDMGDVQSILACILNLDCSKMRFKVGKKEITETNQINPGDTVDIIEESIWDHDEVFMIPQDLASLHIFEGMIKKKVPASRKCDILNMAGINQRRSVTVTEYEASLMTLTNQQKLGFDFLLKNGFDREVALQVYLSCDCNYENSLSCLREIDNVK